MKNKKVIPNCAICTWFFGFLYRGFCRAQGGQIARFVYNKRKCKKLFKPEESKK